MLLPVLWFLLLVLQLLPGLAWPYGLPGLSCHCCFLLLPVEGQELVLGLVLAHSSYTLVPSR